MSIDAIKPGIGLYQAMSALQNVKGFEAPAPIKPVQETVKSTEGGFGEMFSKALGEVNTMQIDADKAIEGLVMKKDGVTPHGAMIALEKADIAFQLMSAVRTKIIQAYQEVLRTQV